MQHYTELNMAQRAAVMTCVRQALGLELDDDGPLSAFAEAVAFSGELTTVLMLSEAIDSAVHLFEASDFNIDATDLIEIHGNATVSLALQIAGVERIEKGTRTTYRVGKAGANDSTLTLESDLLARWAAHYQ